MPHLHISLVLTPHALLLPQTDQWSTLDPLSWRDRGKKNFNSEWNKIFYWNWKRVPTTPLGHTSTTWVFYVSLSFIRFGQLFLKIFSSRIFWRSRFRVLNSSFSLLGPPRNKYLERFLSSLHSKFTKNSTFLVLVFCWSPHLRYSVEVKVTSILSFFDVSLLVLPLDFARDRLDRGAYWISGGPAGPPSLSPLFTWEVRRRWFWSPLLFDSFRT